MLRASFAVRHSAGELSPHQRWLSDGVRHAVELQPVPDGFGLFAVRSGGDLLPGCPDSLRQPLCSVQQRLRRLRLRQPVRFGLCDRRLRWSERILRSCFG